MTNDGLQMCDGWICGSGRLDEILGRALASELRVTKNYTRLLAKVAPDGTIVYKELNELGKVIGSFTP